MKNKLKLLFWGSMGCIVFLAEIMCFYFLVEGKMSHIELVCVLFILLFIDDFVWDGIFDLWRKDMENKRDEK